MQNATKNIDFEKEQALHQITQTLREWPTRQEMRKRFSRQQQPPRCGGLMTSTVGKTKNVDFERERAIHEIALLLRDCPVPVAEALRSELQRSVESGPLRKVYQGSTRESGGQR